MLFLTQIYFGCDRRLLLLCAIINSAIKQSTEVAQHFSVKCSVIFKPQNNNTKVAVRLATCMGCYCYEVIIIYVTKKISQVARLWCCAVTVFNSSVPYLSVWLYKCAWCAHQPTNILRAWCFVTIYKLWERSYIQNLKNSDMTCAADTLAALLCIQLLQAYTADVQTFKVMYQAYVRYLYKSPLWCHAKKKARICHQLMRHKKTLCDAVSAINVALIQRHKHVDVVTSKVVDGVLEQLLSLGLIQSLDCHVI
eukprot:TRINITY_DN859_c0_g1_i1.p7 TRINITY_DN859_c0_g1~~TRINITY_DN859_c0_g1_i1.p7  ORF type:complete len:252 (+),score=-40.95 TRINITY_DN859_c0_g1_i1:2978-3733(+)